MLRNDRSDACVPQCHPLERAVSRETVDRLEALVALVLKWSRSMNLVSAADRSIVWDRHVQDSLRLLPLIEPGVDRAIDLGSGAGFPGLVLAIASGLHVDLVESNQRKAAFLLEARRITDAPVTVHCTRIEALQIERASLVTARALAPLPTLLKYTAPLLLPGGTALFLKGSGVGAEIIAARQSWRMSLACVAAPQTAGSTILVVKDLAHVP